MYVCVRTISANKHGGGCGALAGCWKAGGFSFYLRSSRRCALLPSVHPQLHLIARVCFQRQPQFRCKPRRCFYFVTPPPPPAWNRKPVFLPFTSTSIVVPGKKYSAYHPVRCRCVMCIPRVRGAMHCRAARFTMATEEKEENEEMKGQRETRNRIQMNTLCLKYDRVTSCSGESFSFFFCLLLLFAFICKRCNNMSGCFWDD